MGKVRGVILLFFLFLGIKSAAGIRLEAAEPFFISEDTQVVYFRDGSSLVIEYTEKELIISGTHVKSNAKISYDTIGFNITLEKTGGMVDFFDFLPVRMLSKAEGITDVVSSKYVLDRKNVFYAALQIYLRKHKTMDKEMAVKQFWMEMNKKGGLDFYLHNIFRVIERVGGSGTSILSSSKAYNNLGTPVGDPVRIEGILNAVEELYGYDWSEATKAKLPEYYDIHLKMYMEPCNTSIVLADEEGNILDTILDTFPLVQYAQMQHTVENGFAQVIEAGNARYRITEESIQKSYICYGTSKEKLQKYSFSDENALKIGFSTGKVEYFQLRAEDSVVYIICERLEEANLPEDNQETESQDSEKQDSEKQEDEKKENEKQEDEKQEDKKQEDENQETVSQETRGSLVIDWFRPKTELKIRAWSPEAPIFSPELQSEGIPVNEYLYLDCSFKKYLLKAEFECKEGEVTLQIPISRTYQLFWREKTGTDENGPIYEEFSSERTVSAHIPVSRKYRYIEIKNLDYFGLSEMTVQNAALPGGESRHDWENGILQGIEMPELLYQHYEGASGHLLYPEAFLTGIRLETIILVGDEEMPAIPEEDFTRLAEERTGQIMARNDSFWFGGVPYFTDEYVLCQGEGLKQGIVLNALEEIPNTHMESDRLLIPETVFNGSYASTGELVYRRILSYQTQQPDVLVYQAGEINHVHVHTPVYCDGILTAENDKYCQLVSPDESMPQLMPDAEGISGRFEVEISNTGLHSQRKGYGERDYSKTYSGNGLSYIARDEEGELRNEVNFPFDVFMENKNAADSGEDVFYPAGSWITIGENKVSFYLPEWVQEGKYEIQFRTISVNGPGNEDRIENIANTLRTNYVAVDAKWVQISGRMYGFQVYDIADYPMWRLVFRSPEGWQLKNALEKTVDGSGQMGFDSKAAYNYAAGIQDEYGRRTGRLERYTLPLIEGAHPYLKAAAAKPGYVIRFRINTSGKTMQRDDSVIEVTPSFYHVDENGKKREEVDLYYVRRMTNGREYLVKIGSDIDRRFSYKQTAGSKLLGIPEKEIRTTAALRGIEYEDYQLWEDEMYSYSGLQSKIAFKTFCNDSYCEKILEHRQIEQIQRNGVKKEELLSLGQTFYFEYSLPSGLMAVQKDYPVEAYGKEHGIDFTEDFWLKSGYLILNFEITATADGKAYLCYANRENQEKGYCNMWDMEGRVLKKKDEKGTEFLFRPGDIIVFPVNSSIRDDYLPGGIY